MAWSTDHRRAFSCDLKGGIRVWDLSEFVTEAQKLAVLTTNYNALIETALADVYRQVQYTNAKVLLVGDTSAGNRAFHAACAR